MMITTNIFEIRKWVKTNQSPQAKFIFSMAKCIRSFEIPAPNAVFGPIYFGYRFLTNAMSNFMRVFFWTPLFKSQLSDYGKRLYLYGGLPYISGSIEIKIGNDCRISGKTTMSGRSTSRTKPTLILGNNIDIGWQTTIAVGYKIVIEDNVRIAGQCFLAGYPGHPLEAKARALGKPEEDIQVGDIILEKDVWLATGVKVMPGVRIGNGTIVAAGSVVTRDLPSGVIAAGCPAKIVKKLPQEKQRICNEAT